MFSTMVDFFSDIFLYKLIRYLHKIAFSTNSVLILIISCPVFQGAVISSEPILSSAPKPVDNYCPRILFEM